MTPLTFVDFPRLVEFDLRRHMPPQYTTEMVDRRYHPVVINPKMVGSLLKQKRVFMACQSIHGGYIWVTAPRRSHSTMRLREFWIDDKQYFVPCCYTNTQAWMEKISWSSLAKMDVKYTGVFLVFVPHDFKETSVAIERCTFIEPLQAYVLDK